MICELNGGKKWSLHYVLGGRGWGQEKPLVGDWPMSHTIRVGLLAEKTLWAFNDIRWLFWRRGSVSPSLLGHNDLICLFVCFFIVSDENSLSPPMNRSIENSVIHLFPFGLPGESKGRICEAPQAATLYWSLDRTSGAGNTFEEGERETRQGELFTPPASCQSLSPNQNNLELLVCWCSA